MYIQKHPGKYPKHSAILNWKVPVTISQTPENGWEFNQYPCLKPSTIPN